MPKTAVVALGGNALTRAGQTGTYDEQSDNAVTMARAVMGLRRSGWRVVIVHGNGPQVGTWRSSTRRAAGWCRHNRCSRWER